MGRAKRSVLVRGRSKYKGESALRGRTGPSAELATVKMAGVSKAGVSKMRSKREVGLAP